MGRTNRKQSSRSRAKPPHFDYPKAPHLIGMDWIELPVPAPLRAAAVLQAIGFSPRGYVGRWPLVALGGTVYLLRQSRAAGGAPGRPAMVIQVTTDNIALKRQQFIELGLSPSAMKRQPRGDMAFLWDSGLGYALRVVGPVRE